jgi:polygalacturonase
MIRIYGSNSQYVTIDNLHITGWAVTNQYRNNTDGYGINVYSSGNVLVTNCYIGNWTPAAPQDGGGCLGADGQVVGFRETAIY